jgi:lysophospholipase L1-like esterase
MHEGKGNYRTIKQASGYPGEIKGGYLVKRILCYGDSNTWGYDPVAKNRFADDIRWTGVLSKTLGSNYAVIEEGLCGRTTVWDDPIEGYKNGRKYLIPCLDTHNPLDLVIIMLGTNDLKKRFSLSAFDIAEGAGVLVKTVRQSQAGRTGNAPPVLLLAPPPTTTLSENFGGMFEGAESKSLNFPEQFARVAGQVNCAFLDTATVIVSSPVDGIHFEEHQHQLLGLAVAVKVREIIG